MECKLKRFYNFTLSELGSMPVDEMIMYWRGVDMLEAQEMLLNMKVADFPQMEIDSKKQLHKEIQAKAFFKPEPSTIKVIKTSDIGKTLGAMGI